MAYTVVRGLRVLSRSGPLHRFPDDREAGVVCGTPSKCERTAGVSFEGLRQLSIFACLFASTAPKNGLENLKMAVFLKLGYFQPAA
jgi:hypothetical protein